MTSRRSAQHPAQFNLAPPSLRYWMAAAGLRCLAALVWMLVLSMATTLLAQPASQPAGQPTGWSSERQPFGAAANLGTTQQTGRDPFDADENRSNRGPGPVRLAQLTVENESSDRVSETLPAPLPTVAPEETLLPAELPGSTSAIPSAAIRASGLSTVREQQIEIRDRTLGETLNFLAEGSGVSFLLSKKAEEVGKLSMVLKDVSPAEAFEAIVGRYDLDFYESAGGRLLHVRLREEVKQDISDPGYRERLRRIYAELEREINETFTDSFVRLTVVGQQIVVRGEAKDVLEAEQILNLVTRNAPIPEGKQGGSLTAQITKSIFNAGGGAQTVSAAGPASDLLAGNVAVEPPNVINMLKVVGEQQVMLRVTVAEVNRSAARSIGLSFNLQNDAGTSVFSSLFDGLATVDTSAMGAGFVPGSMANMPAALDNGQVNLAINALRQLNLARTLAEPNLTALNGRTATFRAGGRFPVPVIAANAADGLQGVRFEEFGVLLEFMPFILDRDRIRLNVLAEVSVRDSELGTNIGGDTDVGGTNVPGLNERSFETTVELREGQTLAVAGLLQNEYVADADRVPFFGDLPLIGRAAAFDQVTSREQELVILITPELVHPLESQESLALPGCDIFEPSDVEFFLRGQLESSRSEDFRAAARTDRAKQASYENCRNKILVGPAGYSCNCGDTCDQCAP